MKKEIETKHCEHFAVLGTNRVAEPRLTKQVEMCALHNHGVKFLFFCYFFFVVSTITFKKWKFFSLHPQSDGIVFFIGGEKKNTHRKTVSSCFTNAVY